MWVELEEEELTHAAVLVVEVDHQAEGPPSHGLGRDEGVLEGGLTRRRNGGAQLKSGEVLDVELVVLKGPERKVRGQRSPSSSTAAVSLPEGTEKKRPETPR